MNEPHYQPHCMEWLQAINTGCRLWWMLLLDWLPTLSVTSTRHQLFATFYTGYQSESGSSNYIIKIICADSAWWAFTSAADRQRIDVFIRRSIQCGFCSINQSTFEELCVDADGRLWRTILSNSDHLLARFLIDKSVAFQNNNSLRRPHNLILSPRLTHLTDCNYINRMIYLDSY